MASEFIKMNGKVSDKGLRGKEIERDLEEKK
jgi:hypothetical protein